MLTPSFSLLTQLITLSSLKLTWTSQCIRGCPDLHTDGVCRVERIASTTSLDVDFTSLRESIQSLQSSSVALDKEKISAERQLKRIIRRIVRRKVIRRKLRKAWCKLKKVFGKKCHRKHEGETQDGHVPTFTTETGEVIELRGVGRAPVWLREQKRHHACHAKDGRWKKLREAVKRVRTVNTKLVAFERGFISEDGIKDREWYKHLAVAPGKWLGESGTQFCVRSTDGHDGYSVQDMELPHCPP